MVTVAVAVENPPLPSPTVYEKEHVPQKYWTVENVTPAVAGKAISTVAAVELILESLQQYIR